MRSIIKAEHLKFKRTFGKFLPIIAPIVTLLLVLALTGGLADAFPAGAWNWWYATLLPGTLAVMCYLSVAKDGKNRYYNLKSLSISGRKLILGKIVYLALGLLAANVIIFAGATIGGAILGTTISVGGAAIATILLTISYLWEIPVYLFLSARFGMFADIFLCMVISIGGVATVADKGAWWLCPSSIPVRLMCPTLGLLPNGLPIPAGSELWSTSIVLPGVLLSLVWFVVCAFLFEFWFEKMEVK